MTNNMTLVQMLTGPPQIGAWAGNLGVDVPLAPRLS
jgi:hypothetical protein